MDISKVLDDAREKMNLTSDYELAKRLEIDKADISHYRKGKRIPNAYACARLAEVLDMDPFELLAQVEAATEKNEARRSYWRAVAERIAAGTVAGFFVCAVMPNDAAASENNACKSGTYCFQKLKLNKALDKLS